MAPGLPCCLVCIATPSYSCCCCCCCCCCHLRRLLPVIVIVHRHRDGQPHHVPTQLGDDEQRHKRC
ncbi:MAG: hypothetical protein ACK4ZJ_16895, partial [Allorhizobium sp.]